VDVFKALRALYEERKKLDHVIESLEDLEKQAQEGREIVVVPQKPPSRRGRKSMDDEARQEVSQRMKAYWARRRQEKASHSD
jgi:hypothetical protein